MRGYFGIGIENPKTCHNFGTLHRSAMILGADFLFSIGPRPKRWPQQASDTMKAWRHIPLHHYEDVTDFYDHLPHGCRLIGVEILDSAKPIATFKHPEQACYLLGAEDHGLSNAAISRCHDIVVLPGDFCLNVSVAGSIVMYDRIAKRMP